MIKAVVFDLDDTLCNTSEVLEPALRSTFEHNLLHFPGKTIDEMLILNEQAFRDTFLDPRTPVPSAQLLIWFRVFELLRLKPQIKPIINMIDQVRSEVRNRLNIIKGADEILEYIKSQNIKIGLLSNGSFIDQAQKSIFLGIDNYFDAFVTVDLCLAEKPDQKAFHYVLDKLKVQPEETIMVGDSIQFDIIGAKNVGMKAILYAGNKVYKVSETNPADGVINHLLDLKKFLQ